jgi:orotidine-5'-phosphate decarboxylase
MTLPIILALDTKDIQLAKSWIKASSGSIDHFKVGLEFYLKHGSQGIKELQKEIEFNQKHNFSTHHLANSTNFLLDVDNAESDLQF